MAVAVVDISPAGRNFKCALLLLLRPLVEFAVAHHLQLHQAQRDQHGPGQQEPAQPVEPFLRRVFYSRSRPQTSPLKRMASPAEDAHEPGMNLRYGATAVLAEFTRAICGAANSGCGSSPITWPTCGAIIPMLR